MNQCWLPRAWESGERWWGVGLNLYALRSARNWGIGDFTDLRQFARIAKSWGADLVGLNPLHALHWLAPEVASPYSATSRHFLNPFYIDIEAAPEFRGVSRPLRASIERARAADLVDYALVGACKRRALATLYAAFREAAPAERRDAFAAFCDQRGESLERYARYCALDERFATEGGWVRGWLTWPQDFRDPASRAISRFASRNRRRIDFHKYVQFLAHEQLAAVAHDPRAAALYLDLAVGVDANSPEVWADRDAYVLDRTAGAPPDALGPLGQNWGLAPLDAAALERSGGAPFAALLRANMRHAAALRIDHVMSLARLFQIPLGEKPAAGSYVPYPFDLMLEVTARESTAAECVVVGEDLGTVPDGFRARATEARILSYRVLLFEHDDAGRFRAPGEYPALALATVTTHDLPTLTGWVLGRDLGERARLGELTEHQLERARAQRRVDASRLLDALQDTGELNRDETEKVHRAIDAGRTERPIYEEFVGAAYRYLACSPAKIVLLQLDDALGELDQVNLPGTFGEYPNWRRKYGADLEFIALDSSVARLAAEIGFRVRGGTPA